MAHGRPVLSRDTGYVTCTVPHRHFDFFYSNKNHLVQLEDTTIKTECGCSMQRTEWTTVAHHRSDLFYHTWREWVELTDKKSEVRQTRRVRWERQEEWGETDKKSEVRQTRDGGRVSKRNVKVPVLKIFWILKSLLTSAINLSQWFSTFFSTGPHYGPSASLTGCTHVIYILRHQFKPTRFIILFIA